MCGYTTECQAAAELDLSGAPITDPIHVEVCGDCAGVMIQRHGFRASEFKPLVDELHALEIADFLRHAERTAWKVQ